MIRRVSTRIFRILSIVFWLNLLPFSPALAQVTGTNGMELTHTENFPEPAEEVRFAEENGRIYPFLVRHLNTIDVMNSDGALLKTHPVGERTGIIYDGGDFFAAVTSFGGKGKGREPVEVVVNVFRTDGSKFYHYAETVEFDRMIPGFILSGKNGDLIELDPELGELKLIGAGGVEKGIDLFEGDRPGFEKNLTASYSKNGNYVAVGAMRDEAVPTAGNSAGRSGYPHLLLFDGQLNEIIRVEYDEHVISRANISPSGEYIAISGYKPVMSGRPSSFSTEIYSKSGEQASNFNILSRAIVFSNDESRALLVKERGVHLVDVGKSVILWSKNFGRRLVTSTALSDDGSTVGIGTGIASYEGGRFVFRDLKVNVIDTGGRDIKEISMQGRKSVVQSMRLSGDGRYLAVSFTDGWAAYKRIDK